MDRLIRQKTTGTADDLAAKLKISKRTVYNHLKWMKEHGAPVSYSKKHRSYVYEQEVEFVATFVKAKGDGEKL